MAAQPQTGTSIISKENIRVAAETVGVDLSEDVIKFVAQDVEYRVREIMQVRSRHWPCLWKESMLPMQAAMKYASIGAWSTENVDQSVFFGAMVIVNV